MRSLDTRDRRTPSRVVMFFDISFDTLRRIAPGRCLVDAPSRPIVWTRRGFALAVLCLIGTAAIVYARWQIDGAVVPWDSKNHFYPMFRFLGEALRHGTLPLWNPYHFSGYPAVADPQSLIFTPSMVLFALVAPRASMQVFDAVIFAHLVAGATGMLGLARRWHWHPAAGVLTAVIFMLGGAASSRLQHTGMIISYAWFPLALWSLEAALERCSLRLAIVAGLFATLMALGRDQVAFLLCLAILGFVAWTVGRAAEPLDYLRRRLPVLACAGIVTLALMIAPILLTLQFVHDSNRPGIAFGMALEGSLDPINLVTLISPNMFGSLDRLYDYWGPGAATAAGNDWTDRTIDYLFVGTLPIVLILWHGIAGGRLARRGAGYAAVLIIIALLYALGRHTPFFGLGFDWIPGVALYRRPADATFVLNIGFALSAGVLLHRFIEDGPPRFRSGLSFLPLVATIVGLAIVIGAGLAFARDAHRLDASIRALLASGGLAAAVVIALWLGRAPRRRVQIAAVLVAATVGQLVWRNADSPLNAEPARNYSAFQTPWPDEAKGLAVLQADLAARRALGEHPRVEILGLEGAWQNASMVLGIEDTIGYNPLRIASYERAVGVAESANDPKLRAFPDTFRGYNSRLAALLGLDDLVLDRRIEDLPRTFPRPHATLIFSGNRFFVYRLDEPTAPRAYVASQIQTVDSDAIIDDGMMPDFVVGRDALVDADDQGKVRNAGLRDGGLRDTPPSSNSRADITTYADNAVTISVDAGSDGILVLHDLYYPGWIATVDGHPVPVLRTNLIFRGVEVPAGHHVVEFSFHPLSLRNLAAAAIGLRNGESE